MDQLTFRKTVEAAAFIALAMLIYFDMIEDGGTDRNAAFGGSLALSFILFIWYGTVAAWTHVWLLSWGGAARGFWKAWTAAAVAAPAAVALLLYYPRPGAIFLASLSAGFSATLLAFAPLGIATRLRVRNLPAGGERSNQSITNRGVRDVARQPLKPLDPFRPGRKQLR